MFSYHIWRQLGATERRIALAVFVALVLLQLATGTVVAGDGSGHYGP